MRSLSHARTTSIAGRLTAPVGLLVRADAKAIPVGAGASAVQVVRMSVCVCVCGCVCVLVCARLVVERAWHEATDGCGAKALTTWEGRRWVPPSCVSQRDTPEQEARRRAKAAAALAALGSDDSDAEQLEGPPVDMHGLFARIHLEEGLDEDGNALSDSGGEYDG